MWVQEWGRARPVQRPAPVQIQARASALTPFVTVRTTRTDDDGIFDAGAAVPAGVGVQVRFRWRQGGRWQYSPGSAPMTFRG